MAQIAGIGNAIGGQMTELYALIVTR
jgi:hypothetical protein